MNLPLLINQLTGSFVFTGLYSFEFVDKKRNTIVEIFFMIPPKSKDMTEVTRSTTNPTLSSNYNTDAGNGTKTVNLSGELFFPYVGSTENPVASDSSGLDNLIDGMTEFKKLQWMLIRYRDYTMTKNAAIDIPVAITSASPEINALYQKVSQLVRDKNGALYDEIRLIYHDYDMDDHYYCRVDSFSHSQSDQRHLSVEYNITLELYEKDNKQSFQKVEVKKTLNEEVDIANALLQSTTFTETSSEILKQISYNANFYKTLLKISNALTDIDTSNSNIQAGTETPFQNVPTTLEELILNSGLLSNSVLTLFLSEDQLDAYNSGDLTLDEILNVNNLSFYNALQKIEIYSKSLKGVLNSTPKQEEIRYYSNADDYTLTTDQFDNDNSGSRIVNDSTFKYYTVQEGDTARIIASRELKDSEKFISILKANSISESDLIEGTLVGKIIKIPVDTSGLSRTVNNLVYEGVDLNINNFLHGKDIVLDSNKNFKISPKGDIAGQSGVNVAFDSLTNRLNISKGTLNVFSPNFGVTNVGDGNAPLFVRIDRYLTDLVTQIQSDPRVESVQIFLKDLKLEGEVLNVRGIVNFIGNSESREVEI
jgi:hypothetical protein